MRFVTRSMDLDGLTCILNLLESMDYHNTDNKITMVAEPLLLSMITSRFFCYVLVESWSFGN